MSEAYKLILRWRSSQVLREGGSTIGSKLRFVSGYHNTPAASSLDLSSVKLKEEPEDRSRLTGSFAL